MGGDERNELTLVSAYRWDVLGTDVVALDARGGRVFRLAGPSAAVAGWFLNGTDHGLSAAEFAETVEALMAEGLVSDGALGDVLVGSRDAMTRRRVIGAAAALGISVLLLPTAAAAASGDGGGLVYDSRSETGELFPVTYDFGGVAGDEEVTLSWPAGFLTDGAVHRVYKRTSPNGTYRVAWEGTETTVTLKNLTNDVALDFILVTTKDGFISAPSSTVTLTPTLILPAIPSTFQVYKEGTGGGTVGFRWDQVNNVDGYRIQFEKVSAPGTWYSEYQLATGVFDQIGETGRNLTLSPTIGGLSMVGQTLRFRIQSYNKRGDSDFAYSANVVA